MKIRAQSAPLSGFLQYIILTPKCETLEIPDAELNSLVNEALSSNVFKGEAEEILPIIKGEKVCILVGIGEQSHVLLGRKLASLIKKALSAKPITPQKPVAVIPFLDTEVSLRAMVDGIKLGLYKWNKYISKKQDDSEPADFDIVIQTQYINWLNTLITIADGVNLARDLSNENADVADSEFLEKTIKDVAGEDHRCQIEVLNRKELEEKGLRLHLAVNQGSLKEPKLIIVTYRGGKENEPYIALVGKGLTFDSGGLNVKTGGSMETMRMDMCGAATVIGTLYNTIQLNLPCNVYFVCGLAENAIGPKSYKPGDSLISYCGKTVEISNTDAEGRLVLADANSYLVKNYQPEIIINIATLTGAVVMALGYEYTGLMSNDRELTQALLSAAEVTDDRAWELPIYPELQEHVKSQIADIKNVGESKCAGTISAGEFLRQFAVIESEQQKWAHLDIAGTSKPSKNLAYFDNGATGSGVRLLTQFLYDKLLYKYSL